MGALDVFVDQVLKVFLTAAGVPGDLPFLENVFFQILEAGTSGLNLRADPRVPGTVALVDKVFQSTICTNCSGDFKPTCKGVHPADMRMEQIDWLKAFSTYLGIEIDPTWLETTVVEDRKHALGGQVDIGNTATADLNLAGTFFTNGQTTYTASSTAGATDENIDITATSTFKTSNLELSPVFLFLIER